MGKIELIVPQNNRITEYKSGTVITIPKGKMLLFIQCISICFFLPIEFTQMFGIFLGVRYGLRNKSNEVCFLRFQTLDVNTSS